MRLRTLAHVQWIALGLLGCSATGGGTVQTGGSASVGGSSVSNSSATGGRTSSGGTTGANSTTATGGAGGNVGGTSSSTGGKVSGGKSSTGGTSSNGTYIATGGASPTGGASGNPGGTSSTGGSKAVGGATNTGGSSAKGGTSNIGATTTIGGTPSIGGSATIGGSSSTGGSNAVGGTGTAGGKSSSTGGSTAGGSTGVSWYTCAALTAQTLASEYDAWKTKFVLTCGTDKARVWKDNTNTTVSEGMGYGILIAAGMRDCDLLKQFHRYYLAAQNFTSATSNANMKGDGLMPWSMTNGCDTTVANDANFASDGDLDAAMGLLQGGSVCADQGSYDYTGGAIAIINALKKNAFITSNGKSILRGGGVGTSINPSYFATGYFRAFAKAVPADATFWQQAVTDAYSLLVSYQNAMSGLFPDWGNADGTQAGGWGYDACRVPWRVATDYAWSGAPEAKTLLDKFRATGMQNKLPYAATDQHNSAFVGSMALSAMSADQATMDSFCTDWLSRQVGTNSDQLDDSQYYQATLRVVYMMLASGSSVSTL